MEQVKQAHPIPNMAFQNQKNFSEKLHRRALKATKEILEHCDKLEFKDDQNETFLFKATNHFYWDLTSVIFYLQQILIDLAENISTANSLQNVVDELNTLSFSIQESIKLEPKKLAVKLKTNVISVGFQVEKLTKIINRDDSHEYKQRILDCQLDLVIYIEKLKISMQFCNVSHAEMAKLAHDINDTMIGTLSQLKTKHQIVNQEFSHYVCRNILHMQCTVDYIFQLRNTGRFTGTLDETFINMEKLGKAFIDESLDVLGSDSPIPKFLGCIKKIHDLITAGMGEIQRGHRLSVKKTDNIEVQKMMQEILLYIFACGFNILISLNTTMEDISS